jgi:hypothetical protein
MELDQSTMKRRTNQKSRAVTLADGSLVYPGYSTSLDTSRITSRVIGQKSRVLSWMHPGSDEFWTQFLTF